MAIGGEPCRQQPGQLWSETSDEGIEDEAGNSGRGRDAIGIVRDPTRRFGRVKYR